MKRIDEAVLIFDSPDDRALLVKEAEADPAFGRRLAVTLALPDGEKKVTMSARKAVINELNPNLYPETRGLWKRLRAVARDVVRFTGDSIRKGTFRPQARMNGLGELGQWEILASIIPAVINAGASVYTSYNQAQTARSIQQMQIDAQMRQIQAAENIAKANAAMTAVQAQSNVLAPVGAAVSNVMDMVSTPVMGVPLWAVAIGLYFLAEKA